MNKDKLSSWALALFVITLFGSGLVFSEYAEPSPLAYSVFILPLAFGALLVKLRTDVRKERAAAAAAEQQKRDEIKAKYQEFRDRYVHVRFPVAGVTFQNPDKTDRQKILLEISFNQAAETDVWLEEEQPDLGEDSGIRVLTDYGCVGYIRRSDKEEARRFNDRTICSRYLEVEQFTNEEGKNIYRADVVYVLDRKSPSQQWYFDDLS